MNNKSSRLGFEFLPKAQNNTLQQDRPSAQTTQNLSGPKLEYKKQPNTINQNIIFICSLPLLVLYYHFFT